MKIISSILAVLISVSSMYSQKEMPKIEKFSQKILQNASKGNIWVMDVMKSYTGQGSTEWDFDYTEVVLARNSHGLPTLIETKEKIEGTANWVNFYRAEISYYNNDTISEYKLKEWSTSTNNWLSELSYYETKNEDGKKLIHFSRAWSNEDGYFVQGNKEIYTYDIDGILTEMEDRDWDYINSIWTNWAKTYFTYDVDNNLTLKLYKIYQSGTYNDYWKTEYTYDASGRLSLEQEWGYYYGWDDYSKSNYTYYENDLVKEILTERYSTKKSGWDEIAKTKYFYYPNNLLDYKEELDLQTSGNSLKYEYTYNDNNKEETFFLYDWNGSDWTLFIKVFDFYDANENQTSYYSQTLDGTWKNYIKEEYTWTQFTSLNSLNEIEIKIYPNPATSILNIISEEKINIELINISGKILYNSLKSSSKYKLDISSYSSGIYFIKLSGIKEEKTFKFFKN